MTEANMDVETPDQITSKTKRVGKVKKEDMKRKRTQRPYPANSFEESMELALRIQKLSNGDKIRRLTLFKEMGKSPTSGGSKMLITNSSKYGITTGSYVAEWLELTADGRLASDLEISGKVRLLARFKLCIENIPAFKALYDEYANKKIPSHEVMKDFLSSTKAKVDDLKECVDLFIVNVKYLGLLQTVAGSEMLFPIQHIVDDIKEEKNMSGNSAAPALLAEDQMSKNEPSANISLNDVCFYIAPIGGEDSEIRRHSDLFLNSIIEPALKDFKLVVVRADKISESGIITSQILEHLLKAKLVIVDLSFHNPNVFYELAIRHASKLPIVQVIRKMDSLPFDVDQVRTIVIDTTDIYSLVPKLETYRSEIATHVRQTLGNPNGVNNPLTVFCPGFHVTLPKN